MRRAARLLALGFLIAAGVCAAGRAGERETGRVEIAVVDRATGKPVACRVHLKDAAGKGQKADKLPFWNDHFVCPGGVTLDLQPGRYTIEVEHGPEYSLHTDTVMVEAGGTKKLAVELRRLVDMPASGWWPGELHVHRPLEDVELL